MSEKLDPEEVKAITNRIFGEAAQIISKYDGFVEKYVGDAVMAVFGIPETHEDDPLRAIRAAREIHNLIDSISPEVEKTIGRSIFMHTGINTGLVVTDEVNMEKGTHGLTGDPINLASRLCDLANSSEILVGHLTQKQSEGHFNFEALDPNKIKGKSESVKIYRLLSAKEIPLSIHRLSGLRADLIGRKAEMDKLGDAVEQLRAGKGTVFSIYGDAGTGKSRLVEEFKATLDPKEIQWREGHSYPYSHNIPYFPLINLFKKAFQIEEGDSQEKIGKKIESSVENLITKNENVAHYIKSLFSLGHPGIEEVSPDFWKVQLQKAIHSILLALTQRSPTVIFLDDLHWGDPSSIELLRSLIAEFRYNAIFLCAYRPPFTLFPSNLADGMKKVYQELPLHDLSPSETQDMLQSLLKTKDIPVDLRRFVQRKVEGNPFYLEEVINDLIESDTLSNENGMWKLTKPITKLDISSTIHGIISARIDRLDKETKRILQEASVIGRNFLYEILKKITTQKDQLESHIDKLKRFDVVREKSFQPDLEYYFKHAIIQEVVYNSLLKKERQEIHECIGLVIENLFQERLAEFFETISFHFKRGKSLYKAIDYLMQSGMKSLKRYSVEESHQYYKEAYDILALNNSETAPDVELLIELLNTWAPVFYYRGNFRDLEALLKKHLDQADSLKNKEKLGMFYLWLGISLWGRLSLDESYQYLRKALLLGEKIGSNRVIGYASAWLPWTCIELGLPKEALAHGEKARRMSDYFKSDYYPYYQSLDCNGYAYWVLGESEKIREHGKALLDFGEKNSSIRAVTWGYYVEGWSYMATGDFPSAIRYNKMAIAASADPFYSQFPKLSLGMSYISDGQYDKAREPLEDVLMNARSLGSEILGTASQAFLAVLL
ncbi:MAG: AAA family ATPase, partial [Desulfobacterales bacterium]|nr:AAA family ATPase [Desulfobacterales bacterium]